ncbi:MAG: nucleotidyltransferase family protein [Spirosomataceae bacterium]
MLTEKVLVEKLSKIKPILKNKYHVTEIGFFGSYANGSATDKSDLDVIVEFSQPIGWDFFRVQDALEAALGIKVDLVTKRALRPQWREAILKQAKYI